MKLQPLPRHFLPYFSPETQGPGLTAESVMNKGSGWYRVLREHLNVSLIARVEEDGFPFMLAPVRCVHQVAQTERGVTCEAEVVHLWSTVHIYLSFFVVYLMTQ
jgi:hypothetical protein